MCRSGRHTACACYVLLPLSLKCSCSRDTGKARVASGQSGVARYWLQFPGCEIGHALKKTPDPEIICYHGKFVNLPGKRTGSPTTSTADLADAAFARS